MSISNRIKTTWYNRYFSFHFISYSKRGRYACIYVDENRLGSIVEELKKKKFVKKIELSGMSDLYLSFEHLDSSLQTKK